MGYRKARKIFILEYQDEELEGLEIKARSLPIGELRRLMNLDPDSTDKTKAQRALGQLLPAFADALVSWNLGEEDGTPVPATLEGIEGQDAGFILSLIGPWLATMSRVQDGTPLPGTSRDGQRSLEASIPMETLSASLMS